MSEVPDGIWVFQNGLWSRDYENYHPEPTGYIRKDVSDTLLKAEREKALREAQERIRKKGNLFSVSVIEAMINRTAKGADL